MGPAPHTQGKLPQELVRSCPDCQALESQILGAHLNLIAGEELHLYGFLPHSFPVPVSSSPDDLGETKEVPLGQHRVVPKCSCHLVLTLFPLRPLA